MFIAPKVVGLRLDVLATEIRLSPESFSNLIRVKILLSLVIQNLATIFFAKLRVTIADVHEVI